MMPRQSEWLRLRMDKKIRMVQDYYATKQLKSKNIPRLNTRGITNCQHVAPLNVCSLGYSAG